MVYQLLLLLHTTLVSCVFKITHLSLRTIEAATTVQSLTLLLHFFCVVFFLLQGRAMDP